VSQGIGTLVAFWTRKPPQPELTRQRPGGFEANLCSLRARRATAKRWTFPIGIADAVFPLGGQAISKTTRCATPSLRADRRLRLSVSGAGSNQAVSCLDPREGPAWIAMNRRGRGDFS
jgi:hypothetical protein